MINSYYISQLQKMDESNVDTFDDVTEDFSPAEEVDPSTIIVIHPGSRFLRIGLASDPVPKKLLNAIARKRKNNNPAYNREDPFVIPKVNNSFTLASFVDKRNFI